jgi:hypothetical protein
MSNNVHSLNVQAAVYAVAFSENANIIASGSKAGA